MKVFADENTQTPNEATYTYYDVNGNEFDLYRLNQQTNKADITQKDNTANPDDNNYFEKNGSKFTLNNIPQASRFLDANGNGIFSGDVLLNSSDTQSGSSVEVTQGDSLTYLARLDVSMVKTAINLVGAALADPQNKPWLSESDKIASNVKLLQSSANNPFGSVFTLDISVLNDKGNANDGDLDFSNASYTLNTKLFKASGTPKAGGLGATVTMSLDPSTIIDGTFYGLMQAIQKGVPATDSLELTISGVKVSQKDAVIGKNLTAVGKLTGYFEGTASSNIGPSDNPTVFQRFRFDFVGQQKEGGQDGYYKPDNKNEISLSVKVKDDGKPEPTDPVLPVVPTPEAEEAEEPEWPLVYVGEREVPSIKETVAPTVTVAPLQPAAVSLPKTGEIMPPTYAYGLAALGLALLVLELRKKL